MDDLLLFTASKRSHRYKLEDQNEIPIVQNKFAIHG